MLLRAHQLAGGEAGNTRSSVLPWHGVSHLPSSLKTRTIFIALTKQDGGVRNQFRSSQQKLSVRHLANVEVTFLYTFFSHFFFPLFFSFLSFCCLFFYYSVLFSKRFPWRTQLNAGFIMHRSSEMASIPPVLCCSTLRWFPKSSLSAV